MCEVVFMGFYIFENGMFFLFLTLFSLLFFLFISFNTYIASYINFTLLYSQMCDRTRSGLFYILGLITPSVWRRVFTYYSFLIFLY